MYQLRKKKILPIVLPSVVEAENFSDHPTYLPSVLMVNIGWQVFVLHCVSV